jgi:hypothetical protein
VPQVVSGDGAGTPAVGTGAGASPGGPHGGNNRGRRRRGSRGRGRRGGGRPAYNDDPSRLASGVASAEGYVPPARTGLPAGEAPPSEG